MRVLPTGTVTFLFTDIEGSTRLLERLGSRYRDLQGRHDAIVRAAILEGGGHEVRTAGDSFFAVFPTPVGALQAAVSVQRALAAEAWPDGAAVRVRMGLHTGEGALGGDDYLGLDVHVAARIAAAAHGGDVLVSGTTSALVQRGLPAGTRLHDLGPHRLKDLSQPESLHRVVIEGLEQDFPPPRTGVSGRPTLPAPLTPLIGREDVSAQVRELLEANRLVTLTGTGGTGKTRLALEVARLAGAAFVDLSAATAEDVVLRMIGESLGLHEQIWPAAPRGLASAPARSAPAAGAGQLRAGGGDRADVIAPLLGAVPGLSVLVTSRTRSACTASTSSRSRR